VIHLYGVIDDELDRLKWIDLFRIAAQGDHAIAHRREIDDAGDAREVLQENTGGHEGDFLLSPRRARPASQRTDVVGLDEGVVLAPEQVLEQDLQ
jgi:hypothetical protein